MSYYRVWLQGRRAVVVEGDQIVMAGTSGDDQSGTAETFDPGCEPAEVIIRKGRRVVARFDGKAVEGYDEREQPFPAPPRPPQGVGRFLWPVWVAKLLKTLIWRLQNPWLQA
jgi:hypothetical protein